MSKYKLTQKTDANGTTQDIMLDASCIDGVVKSVNNTSPDANGNVNAGLIYVEGDTTATSPIWTASSSEITSYYTGLTIAFKIGVAGLSGTQTTLNINGLGAKKVFENVSTNPSTHYAVGSILFMAYDTTADSGNGAWRISADRTVADVYVRQYQFGSNAAGTSPKYPILTRYNLTNKNGTYDTAYTRYRTDVTIDTSTGNLDAPTMSENGTSLSNKYQSALVSGTNIKTINNESILGSGNITIEGGSSITSIDGLAGGQLTSAIILSGGDAASGVANMQLDTNGQITAKGTTSTLFGRNSSNTLLLGHSSHALAIRGSATRPTYNGNSMALYSDIPSTSTFYPKSGGALNDGAVITMTGSNPYVGLQETGGTQYYLQGYSGEIGISVSGNWGTKRLSLDANGKVFIPSKSIGDGTYTYTLPSKTGTIALLDDVSGPTYIADSVGGTATASGTNSCAFGSTSSCVGYSVAIGYGAKNSGNNCVSIGYNAVVGDTKTGTVVIGRDTQANDYGTAVGYSAKATGSYGVGLGYLASASKESAIAIGRSALARYNNTIVIGNNNTSPNSAASTRIGCAEYTYTGRALILGAGASSFTYMNAAGSSWTSASDIRDKTDIQEIEHALDFIKKIHPITYVMNEREKYLYRDESGRPLLNEDGKQYYDVEAHARGDKKKHRRFAGVSAQETYQAMLDCYKNDNYAQIVDNSHYDNPESEYLEQYSVEYERFVPFLIKAIQEQQEQIEELKQLLNK